MKESKLTGHLLSLMTIFIWGTTYISIKVLLTDFKPIEILFIRFVIGFIVLFLIRPHLFKWTNRRHELLFFLCGLTGVCLYGLLANIALTYTMASNVGVITSVSPFFTAILIQLFMKGQEKLGKSFFLGFVVAMVGICLVSFNGLAMHINPVGDLITLLSAFIWALYSFFTKKIGSYGYGTVETTRRSFMYGIICMIPVLFLMDFNFRPALFLKPANTLNMLYLALGASALSFLTWGIAIKILGAIKTSIYLYVMPIFTVITSVLILHEQFTLMAGIGTALTLSGLLLSEARSFRRKGRQVK